MRDVEVFITLQFSGISLHGVLPAALPLFIQIVRSDKAARHVFALHLPPELRDIKINASRQLSSDITLSMKQRVHERLPLMIECPMSNSKAIQPRPTIWPLANKGHHQRVRRLSPRLHPCMIPLSTISWDHPLQRLDRTKSISRRSFRKGPAIEARLCADS